MALLSAIMAVPSIRIAFESGIQMEFKLNSNEIGRRGHSGAYMPLRHLMILDNCEIIVKLTNNSKPNLFHACDFNNLSPPLQDQPFSFSRFCEDIWFFRR